MRRLRSEAEWREIVNRYETGELKHDEFCQVEGISKSGLSKWRRRILGLAEFPGRFVEMKAPTEGSIRGVELKFPSGLVLRIAG